MAEDDKRTKGSHESPGQENGRELSRRERREAAERAEREQKEHQARRARQEKDAEREAKAAARAAEKERAERARQEAEAAKEEARALKRAERERRARIRRARWKKFLHGLKVFLIVLVIITAIAAGGATAGGYFVTKSEKNLPRVFLDGIDVGGLTRAEAMDKLAASGWDENAKIPLTVKLPAGVSFQLDIYKSGAMQPREDAVEKAYRYGRSGSIYENLLLYLKGLVLPTDVGQESIVINEDYVRGEMEKAIAEFQEKTVDEGYEVDREDNELRLLKGAGQMQIDGDRLYGEIAMALRNEQKELDHQHIDNELTAPDFETIYQELHVPPVDATFTEDGFDVIDEVVGCTFDVEQALSLWEAASPAETVMIPMKITYPEVTAESLRSMLYRDKLGAQTTLFGGSTPERINNIQLAASKINGQIVFPGEVFSYNATVGKRTQEAGFMIAAAYQDGEVVQELGGGVCQVSSTLYCAALLANLETVEREAHYFMVNYLPWAHDATVSWPSPDYKFRNSRDYPVKIVAWADTDDLTLHVEIWGTDVDGSYVELTYDRYYFTEDNSEVIIGWHVYGHRNVYDKDGNLIEVVEEPDSMYHKHEEDIER